MANLHYHKFHFTSNVRYLCETEFKSKQHSCLKLSAVFSIFRFSIHFCFELWTHHFPWQQHRQVLAQMSRYHDCLLFDLKEKLQWRISGHKQAKNNNWRERPHGACPSGAESVLTPIERKRKSNRKSQEGISGKKVSRNRMCQEKAPKNREDAGRKSEAKQPNVSRNRMYVFFSSRETSSTTFSSSLLCALLSSYFNIQS